MLGANATKMTRVLTVLFVGLMLSAGGSIVRGQSNLPKCSDVHYFRWFWHDCLGSQTFANGDYYVGDFKGGKPNWQGNMYFANRDKYVGGFKDGKKHGRGTYTWANGDEFVGEFKDGNFGQGTVTFPNGDNLVGEFKEGNSARGTYTYANGMKYIGEFKDKKRNGQGTITFRNGDNFVGEFKDDNWRGTYTYANGMKYIGEFKGGKFNGEGTQYQTDGSILASGIWADGNFIGLSSLAKSVPMKSERGIYVVPVLINDAITLDFVVDSGAADVSIPADVVMTLMRTKTLQELDFLGQKTYVLADGSKVPSQTFRIRSLKVGGKVIENVNGSIASEKGPLLLGQSFLSRFKSWSVDNTKHELVFE